MGKLSNIRILIISTMLFLISCSLDEKANLLFKDLKFLFFDIILSIATNFGVVIALMLVIPSLIFYKKSKKAAYLLYTAFAVSFILAFIIKLIVLRQRPLEAFTYPFTAAINYSFPSMHSMVAFSLLPILVKYSPKQKYFWIILAFLVAFSRLYFGFHFLSDIVFGALAGYFIGNLLLGLNNKGKLWK